MPRYVVAVDGVGDVEVHSPGFQAALDRICDELRPFDAQARIRSITYGDETLMIIGLCRCCGSPRVEVDDGVVDLDDGVVCEGCLKQSVVEFDRRAGHPEPVEVKSEDPWQS